MTVAARPAIGALDTPARLGPIQYLGYAAGEVANNLAFQMVSTFILLYYTDVAGISAGTAGTLLLVVRIWGGVTDLLAGQRVDKTSTRWGKFRPYLLFGPLPLFALLVAVFSIPGGLGDGGLIAWALVSYALFQLAYSLVNIPYGALAAAMTQEPDERAKLSSSRSVAAAFTILAIAAVVSPQIQRADDLQRSLTVATVVFAVVGFALYLWCFATTKETVQRDAETVSMRDTGTMLRQNRPLIILCSSCLLFLTGMFSLSTVAIYYARDVLGNADYYIVMAIVQTVAMVVAAALVPKTVASFGKKGAYILSGIVAVVGAVGFALAPSSIPAIGIAFYGLLGLGLGGANTLIFALQADTVDYGDWQSGVRAEGASYSVLSFTRSIGQGIGAAAAAFTIGIGGYVSGAAAHSDAALNSIRVAAGIVPAVAIVAAVVVMLAYPLTEERFREITAEIAVRRAGQAT